MRRLMMMLVGALALALIPGVALADAGPAPRGNSLVVFTGAANVAPDDHVQSVVVFDGSARVEGTVRYSVVVFSGPAVITGTVEGDVVVFDGLLTVQKGAHIGGDVFADRRAIDPGAQIDGTTQSTKKFAFAASWASVAILAAIWLTVAVSLLILGLLLLWLAPRGADAVIAAGRNAVGSSIGWGLAVVFGLPLIAVVAMATVVGLPLGLGLLFALGLLYMVGMVAGAWFLGRLIMKTSSRGGAFVIGWLIVSGISLIPGLGGVLWLASTVYGSGIICVATYRARKPATPLPTPATPPLAS
jgi:Polymer-forming cytoskeletal